MTMIVVGSTRSSGATTVSMAVAAWMEGAVLIEADPDGGVLALRYGLSREPGLVTLAAARALDSEGLLEHAQRLPGGLPVVVAPESPDRSSSLLRTAGPRVASLLSGLGAPIAVIDVGRLSPSSPASALLPPASAVLLVTRPRADELVAAAERLSGVTATTRGVAGLVLAGSGPYSPEEVTSQLGCPVLGTVAEDPRAAAALAQGGSPRTLARSALARSARAVAENVLARIGEPEKGNLDPPTTAATGRTRRAKALA